MEGPQDEAQPVDRSLATGPKEHTTVTRLTMRRDCMEKAEWTEARRRPARFVMEVFGKSAKDLIVDLFGWRELIGDKGEPDAIMAFARYRRAAEDPFLALSGRGAIFIEQPKEQQEIGVDWFPRAEGEEGQCYLLRAFRNEKNELGIIWRRGGGAAIGLRTRTPTATAADRLGTWKVQGLPMGWCGSKVEDFLRQARWQSTLR